jgi:hypothetical protein
MPASPQPDKIRLVRVQDALHGMHVDHKGDLILQRDSAAKGRNTCHFAVNGVVTNHVYGQFDGPIAIVADPRELIAPSGFRPEDTWFHHDREGKLSVGKAILLAPLGTEVPAGANVRFYDPAQPGARDAAVHEYLSSIRIEPQTVGMWGWRGQSMMDQELWLRTALPAMYGSQAPGIQRCPHSASMDDAIDTALSTCAVRLAAARENYDSDETGVTFLSTERLKTGIQEARARMEKFSSATNEDTRHACAGYFDGIAEQLAEMEAECGGIEARYQRPYFVQQVPGAPEHGPFTFDQVTALISSGGVPASALVRNIRLPEAALPAGEVFSDLEWPAASDDGIPDPDDYHLNEEGQLVDVR